MVYYVSAFMYPDECRPFVCMHRSDKIRVYHLTKASATRLAFACRGFHGEFTGESRGWSWRRAKEEA